jgi:hypothetical protein
MTSPDDPAIRSGAARVEETEHLAAGLTVPRGSPGEADVNEFNTETPEPELADLTLSMFTQASSTRVRVGNSRNASELYEHAFNSVDEANNAMLDNGILTSDQVPRISGTAFPGRTEVPPSKPGFCGQSRCVHNPVTDGT